MKNNHWLWLTLMLLLLSGRKALRPTGRRTSLCWPLDERWTSLRMSKENKAGEDYTTGSSRSVQQINRFGGDVNFAANWQAKGDYYLCMDNLEVLNKQLTAYETNRSRKQKMDTLRELSLTYFARFHHLIRREYQFEKKMVQDRIRKWGNPKLKREGLALFDMRPTLRGALFQDQIIRFDTGKGSNLPVHKFAVGDSVRITPSGGNPLRPDEGIDGVVLGKGKKYIDLCVRITDMSLIEKRRRYRLDDFVNRVSYDRMLEALQLFLRSDHASSSYGGPTDGLLSRALRDLILYSYPNSLVRLSLGAGSLRLGIPVDERMVQQRLLDRSSMNMPRMGISEAPLMTLDKGEEDDEGDEVEVKNTYASTPTVSIALEEARRRYKGTGSFASDDVGDEYQLGEQEQEGGDLAGGACIPPALALDIQVVEAEELNGLQMEREHDDDDENEETWAGIGASPYAGVFRTNDRLQRMSEHIPNPPHFHKRTFDEKEIEEALHSVLSRGRVDIDAALPVGWDVWSAQGGESRKEFAEESETGDGEVEEKGKGKRLVGTESLVAFLRDISQGEGIVGGPSVGDHSKFARNTADEVALSSSTIPTATAAKLKTPNLMNKSQKRALFDAIQRPVSLIQGPPGTGKTRTACNILSTVVQLKHNRLRDGGLRAQGFKTLKLLAVAHSNVATDNLLDGLLQQGVKVVRIGRPTSVRPALWAYTLDARLQLEPSWLSVKEKVDAARIQVEDAMAEDGPEALEQCKRRLQFALKRLAKVEKQAAVNVLKDADIVVSTCVGSGGELLKDFTSSEQVRFSTVLVDEAAQCVETAVLPAVVHHCDQLILVGDQNQLPPVVMSPAAADEGFGISLFARLVAAGLKPSLLQTQYRMHPTIAQFSSKEFYNGQLADGVTKSERPRPLLPNTGPFSWPHPDEPVAFLDTCQVATAQLDAGGTWDENFEGEADDDARKLEATASASDTSYLNAVEADCVVAVVQALMKADSSLTLSDIGVISPYAAQVRRMTELFRDAGMLQDPDFEVEGSAAAMLSRSTSTPTATGVYEGVLEIRTVDGFQGREKEVIIISTVRSNPRRQLGFLKDWRRLNVCITRARRGLVVLGDGNTLRADERWRAFVRWCVRNGCSRQLDVNALKALGIKPAVPTVMDDIEIL